MENKNLRIRINLATREFEADGNSDYIMSKFGDFISECMDSIKNAKSTKPSMELSPINKAPLNFGNEKDLDLPETFG